MRKRRFLFIPPSEITNRQSAIIESGLSEALEMARAVYKGWELNEIVRVRVPSLSRRISRRVRRRVILMFSPAAGK